MECLWTENYKGALQGVNWRIQVHAFVYTMSSRSARSRRPSPKFHSLIFLSRAKVLTIFRLSWKPVATFMPSVRDPFYCDNLSYLAYRNCFTTHFQRNAAFLMYLSLLPVDSLSVLFHFHAFLDLVALWPLCSWCLKTQPLIRCNH